jgi:serine/threonine-protein kinase
VTSIKLSREWQLGKQFDKGGMGRVYEAVADDGSEAVIKLIPKAPGAERELLFEELSGLPNIIPILDSGEWKNSWVLVMPRAEMSLRKHLEINGGKLDLDKALPILLDVAEALAALDADVVHRDLKPENILLFEGRWCIADFGIARYAQATTAPDTHKFSWTPPYAAPEQWRGERATHATDVYAFGVMAFELLQGRRPFDGPDFREQHLDQFPPPLIGLPPALASLIIECLYKPPAARPSPTNLLARLRARERPASPGVAKLQEVQEIVAAKRAAEGARLSAAQSRGEKRHELFEVAKQSLHQIVETLYQRVLELAPATEASESDRALVLSLDEASLVIDHAGIAPENWGVKGDYQPPFDVIAHSAIAALKSADRVFVPAKQVARGDGSGYEGRAHSLWFCDAHDEGVYRWYELAFMITPSMGHSFNPNPAALAPTNPNAHAAFSRAFGSCQLAWEPLPFDQGEEEQFIERWIGWLAAAADGTLSSPRYMPEDSGGRHRKGHAVRHN